MKCSPHTAARSKTRCQSAGSVAKRSATRRCRSRLLAWLSSRSCSRGRSNCGLSGTSGRLVIGDIGRKSGVQVRISVSTSTRRTSTSARGDPSLFSTSRSAAGGRLATSLPIARLKNSTDSSADSGDRSMQVRPCPRDAVRMALAELGPREDAQEHRQIGQAIGQIAQETHRLFGGVLQPVEQQDKWGARASALRETLEGGVASRLLRQATRHRGTARAAIEIGNAAHLGG